MPLRWRWNVRRKVVGPVVHTVDESDLRFSRWCSSRRFGCFPMGFPGGRDGSGWSCRRCRVRPSPRIDGHRAKSCGLCCRAQFQQTRVLPRPGVLVRTPRRSARHDGRHHGDQQEQSRTHLSFPDNVDWGEADATGGSFQPASVVSDCRTVQPSQLTGCIPADRPIATDHPIDCHDRQRIPRVPLSKVHCTSTSADQSKRISRSTIAKGPSSTRTPSELASAEPMVWPRKSRTRALVGVRNSAMFVL